MNLVRRVVVWALLLQFLSIAVAFSLHANGFVAKPVTHGSPTEKRFETDPRFFEHGLHDYLLQQRHLEDPWPCPMSS